ncbi:mechanosensitive ion channel family protein [Jiulongibacter sediminis]|uniref:Mechanosensitive ion channel protein MscS n=1 Tax=Jiulongibacter sediminis TaxID=1605367 RepID=A0A0P7C6I9_9BACT|nr:mechanosensitive ion channel [Jiulongibacter sediminis]KPM47937.1 mechanosensitive ion channel protein MscS [Jiulongibacter sediminis]TBX24120.1 mechanosensitive ion channel protein MscS [Jiulongibacter sediminis]
MNLEITIDRFIDSLVSLLGRIISQVPSLLLAVLIVAVGFLISTFLSRVFNNALKRRSKDPLVTNFLSKTIRLVIITLFILLALDVAGLGYLATGLLTAAGASAIIVGFAFKDVGENFISGIILAFNRPFNVNDTVLVGDIFGKVKAMEFRYTKMKTFDGRDVYIPNSDVIKKAVYNYTEDGFYRLEFEVGIDYEDNIELAKEVIIKAVTATPDVIDEGEHDSFVTVESLGVSTVNLKVFFWTSTMEYRRGALEIKSEVVKNVKNAILEHGLNMPADITEIKLYGSQTSIPVELRQAKDSSDKSK